MRNLTTILLVAVMAATCTPQTARAAGDTLEVIVGSGIVLIPPGKIERIAVTDEKVATVTVLSVEEALVQGQQAGRTSVFAWLETGERMEYNLEVRRDLAMLREALQSISSTIELVEPRDSRSLMVRGEVESKHAAELAMKQVTAFVGAMKAPVPTVMDLLTYPDPDDPNAQLALALRDIDSRLNVRRVLVAADGKGEGRDSYVLTGRVRSVGQLMQAMALAERQLGEMGYVIDQRDPDSYQDRNGGNVRISGGGSGGRGNALQNLGDAGLRTPGLAARLSRGLLIQSESGRVVSFVEVDEIKQILVSIRVLNIDRGRARSQGINYSVSGDYFSMGHFGDTPDTRFADTVRPASVIGPRGAGALSAGNLVGAYVSSSVSVLSAIELMQRKAIAHSLAEPNVLTLTGEEAVVLVGGEVPIPSTSVGNVTTVQGYLFRSFGVRLEIRPTVDENNIVTLEVAPSIVTPDNGLSVDDVPGFKVQRVQTTARVKQGESLILGGLITKEEAFSESMVPIVGHIPLLGALFKSKSKDWSERELLFVITPKVLDNVAEEGMEAPNTLPSMKRMRDLPWRLDDPENQYHDQVMGRLENQKLTDE